MRDFDGFTDPSDYVREFYADYVWDASFFNTLPNGADSTLFRPALVPSDMRTAFEDVARRVPQKYTWQKTAQKLIELFEKSQSLETEAHQTAVNLFPPIFCRRYNPNTFETTSDAYRLGINRYEHLEKALGETLLTQHKTAEVASVFEHFKAKTSLATSMQLPTSDRVRSSAAEPSYVDEDSATKGISSNTVIRADAA